MPTPYNHIPEDVLKQAAADAAEDKTPKQPEGGEKPPKGQNSSGSGKKPGRGGSYSLTPGEHRQRRLFKLRRAGIVLSREEVKAIKEGRKKLRKEMKGRGIRSKREFELVAGSLGLYFDKRRGFFFWLLRHWLAALIGALLTLLLILFLFSIITRMRGHFTINLSDDMFREGFTLSETVGFENPSTELFAQPATNVPCVSIIHIPDDVDKIDGEHNGEYFAYTYYIRNEGETVADYEWQLKLNSESLNLSDAAWIMLFEDGKMRFYAEPNAKTGKEEALPPLDDNSRGYINVPIMEAYPENDQFELIRQTDGVSYYRAIPDKFKSDTIIATGTQFEVKPMDVHKYTVVLWLEGDDPDTDNSKIGGHLGSEMDFRLKRSGTEYGDGTDDDDEKGFWDIVWETLKFWE